MIRRERVVRLQNLESHYLKNWTYSSVKRLLKRFKDCGTNMNRKQSSGRPRSVTTEENADLIKELICSQEDAPHTHLAPRKIADQTGISQMNDGYRIRRYDRATAKKV